MKKWLLCLGLSLLCVMGCRRASEQKKRKLVVVATTGMLADAVKAVGGAHVHVEGLMGPGVDPHMYKATAADARKLAGAQLIVYNGLHLEGKMQGILEKMGQSRMVVAASDRIPKKLLHKAPGTKKTYDPHIWFDVSLWQRVVHRITAALVKAAPKHTSLFHENGKRYQAQLTALHIWVKKQMALIPKSQRILITSHDAFGYMGAAYGLKVVGLQGVSTVAEAGVKDVERVVELLVKQKLGAIFVESSVSSRSVKAVIQSCASRGHKVKIGGELFSDAMGAAGTREGTYIGMVEHNVQVLVKALGGKAITAFGKAAPATKTATPTTKAAKRTAVPAR